MMPKLDAINNTVPYELIDTGRPYGPLKKATYGISVFVLVVWLLGRIVLSILVVIRPSPLQSSLVVRVEPPPRQRDDFRSKIGTRGRAYTG